MLEGAGDGMVDLLGLSELGGEQAEGSCCFGVVDSLNDEVDQFRDRVDVAASAGREGGSAANQRIDMALPLGKRVRGEGGVDLPQRLDDAMAAFRDR